MNSVESNPPVPVAIIGIGCLFPGAEDLSAYWANIRDRRDAIAEVPATHWRPDDYFDPDPKAPDRTYARRGGFLTPVDFPPLDFGIAPNNLEATDTTQLLGLLVARQALDDAGYGPGRDFDRDRVSVILGVTGTLELVIPLGARLGHPIWRRALKDAGVADDTAEIVVRGIAGSYVGWQENSFPGLLGNVAAGRIANRLDLGGTNCVIDAACASSLGALNLALLELASGRCDMALTGGLDTFNDIFMYMCFSKTPALSPTGDARPFDAAGDGTILGEGLGVLVLKRLEDARRDGDRVYAVIRGVGTSSDGKGGAVYAPSASGQARALRRAYQLAGVSPATVELVEAHGTGTKVGDATELAALTEVYREARAEGTWCALGSVKSQIGHTKAAAGAAGLIKAALALYHKVLPPTIKVTRPIEGPRRGAPFYVNTEAAPVAAACRSSSTRRGQRLRLRRQQFPLRARGGQPHAGRDRLGRRRADRHAVGRSARGVARGPRRLAHRPGVGRVPYRGGPFAGELPGRPGLPALGGGGARGDRPDTAAGEGPRAVRGGPQQHGRGNLRRQGARDRPPGDALSRPGGAVHGHAPRPGMPVPDGARRPGRVRRRAARRRPTAGRPDLSASRVRRRGADAAGGGAAVDRGRAAGDRRGLSRGPRRPRPLRRATPRRSPGTALARSPRSSRRPGSTRGRWTSSLAVGAG